MAENRKNDVNSWRWQTVSKGKEKRMLRDGTAVAYAVCRQLPQRRLWRLVSWGTCFCLHDSCRLFASAAQLCAFCLPGIRVRNQLQHFLPQTRRTHQHGNCGGLQPGCHSGTVSSASHKSHDIAVASVRLCLGRILSYLSLDASSHWVKGDELWKSTFTGEEEKWSVFHFTMKVFVILCQWTLAPTEM